MKLLRVIVFLVLLVGVLASVSNINLNPTGNYAKLSTKGGLYVSVAMLIYLLFAELGYLPFRFKGRKRRSAISQMMGPMFGDRDVILKVNTVHGFVLFFFCFFLSNHSLKRFYRCSWFALWTIVIACFVICVNWRQHDFTQRRVTQLWIQL